MQVAPTATSFADWMTATLRREGLTQEEAARQLGVSVKAKTVSRWVGGETEPDCAICGASRNASATFRSAKGQSRPAPACDPASSTR